MNRHTLRFSRNEGGVCDNCGLPEFVHDLWEGECPPDNAVAGFARRVDRWFAIVAPARDAYQESRRIANNMRRRMRRGTVSETDTEAAERRRDELLVEYRAAIRKADREA